MFTPCYSAFRVNLDGSLSDRANLDGIGEVNEWLYDVHGKHATVLIVRDDNGAYRKLTDAGMDWETIDSSAWHAG